MDNLHYIKQIIGDLMLQIASLLAERDALKARVAELESAARDN